MVLEPIIRHINASYGIDYTSSIVRRAWWVPLAAISLYLAFIVLGKRWMEKRQPYSMRVPLFLWNLSLALFSITGAVVMVPDLWRTVMEHGFQYSVCYTTIHNVPLESFFSLLFAFSKLVEFGDTFFVVMRKTPLNFLHWYHHITVSLFSWRSLGIKSSPAHWYCSLNYLVHSVMYSYYVIKSTGLFRVPKAVSRGVTALQMIQFLMGLVVAFTVAYIYWLRGEFCHTDNKDIAMGLAIYLSYLVLFGNFFYQRYLKPVQKKVQ